MILPTYNEAETSRPSWAGSARPRPRRHPRGRRPRRRHRRPGRAARRRRPHRPGKLGLGRAYTAGFAQALGHGAATCARWTPTSPRPGGPPRLIEPRWSGADLGSARATCTAAGSRTGTCSGASSSCRLRVRPPRARRADPRPDRRLQVLPRRDAARIDAAPPARRATPSRSSSPTARAARLEDRRGPIRFRERRLGDPDVRAVALEAAWRVPALRYGPRRWPRWSGQPSADPSVHEG